MSAFADALAGIVGMGYGQTPQKNAPSAPSPLANPTVPDLATSPTTASTNMSPAGIQQQANPLGSPNVNPILSGQPPMVIPSQGVNPNQPNQGAAGGMGVGT